MCKRQNVIVMYLMVRDYYLEDRKMSVEDFNKIDENCSLFDFINDNYEFLSLFMTEGIAEEYDEFRKE